MAYALESKEGSRGYCATGSFLKLNRGLCRGHRGPGLVKSPELTRGGIRVLCIIVRLLLCCGRALLFCCCGCGGAFFAAGAGGGGLATGWGGGGGGVVLVLAAGEEACCSEPLSRKALSVFVMSIGKHYSVWTCKRNPSFQ